MQCDSSKKIDIVGKNNRYQMKKVTNSNNTLTKRAESAKWTFSPEYYTPEKQLIVLNMLHTNDLSAIENNEHSEVVRIMAQQINKKIMGYKQQDMLKKRYVEADFLTFRDVVSRLIDSQLKCYYCRGEMCVLYDVMRETLQWSVDRIDNDKGHVLNNYHLSCLDCNLKKRRKADETFRFTKQLQLVRENYVEEKSDL